ncbi:hypothetical protein A2311_05440 [candidate division WOR-1 bacterium RIFOXYB2_FULL_48_7]|uniref:Beta-lactamase class A catalytic domain-containing protein n=1 Tax=candidate division WOR-1 bacterium RIFOXYB2_FULL_48_7 TaxID=1802583 RepID=A0A1F4TKC6_UNCSA|nr:MAG: hypothetical protein A2311_05440 [candidate division WOR-1 bacterium RIFOXYB2_FULL_48_7]
MRRLKFFIGLLAWNVFCQTAWSYDPLALQAKLNHQLAPFKHKVGVAFIDLKTGDILQVNGSMEFPAASVAKVPVMAAAYHLVELKQLNLAEKLKLRKEDKVGGSGYLQWMKPGTVMSLKDLIGLMIMRSDNTATKMLVDRIGLGNINQYLQANDIKNTVLNDHTMLVEPPSNNNNRTCPLDMAYLTLKIQESYGFDKDSSQEMLYFMKNQRYRWGIWRGVPPGTIVADKTGNLTGILNDVGVVYTKAGNYVLAIFTRNFPKKREGRKIINDVSRLVYEEYTGEKVPTPEVKTKKRLKRKIIAKRKLSRRPSVKSRRLKGHSGRTSGHKLPSPLSR